MNDTPAYVADRNSLLKDLEHFINDHLSEGKKLAILLININHFRQINVIYGYQSADILLEEFVHRLKKLSREQDYIARVGNSEFIMVLPEILNEGHVTLAANKLLSCLNTPFSFGDSNHKVIADMGIALFPDHAIDIQGLIQKAELALLDARSSAKSYSIYKKKSQQVDFYNWDIEDELRNAQERDEFELFFQPQVNLQTGKLFGAEALIRWNNREKGRIRPDLFIPIAEESGQIHSITWWTINAALRLIKDWPETLPPLQVSVNLSAKVLSDPELVHSVRSALSIWGAKPEQLTLEVTESALMEDMDTSFITLDELRSFGLNISIDDFGTGYSSMAYFKYIPANELKIDQSFIRYMLDNEMDQHIVKTVIEMAHGFDIKVVAEGIENEETYNSLKELGCDIAQGYFLAKPMPQDEFIQWLKNYQS
ncbi:MAG: bifunctional diguanylate cyclase/phosphodiesterase [endosymbiont of Galathealinum brachiosum]|uniref:Bifunctional diguanylate cyclase/phosphodiesterase n=1 Tax=endosymbiont of Galathealinum brachiosum TaxID=2200906 RepID=A0A370DI41_9GAMM|nr:MAG: bifunctional diguanylate cyclase/phosphodiesterase [endosymbiont of Galathealinum brachiosum]